MGGEPPVISYGSGSRVVDVDGNNYIDYVCAYGPLILGHAHPGVVDVIAAAATRGTAYGATSELEIELPRLIVRSDSVDGVGALRQLRDRGDDVGAPAGSRLSPGGTKS